MTRTLHITNGDSVSLRETGLGGEVVVWQDVLHEGPVPAGLTLDELRPVRARFLAGLSGRPESEILSDFESRDRILGNFRELDEVVLWFEHDLFDQLQLIQILDWFCRQELEGVKLTLIDSDRYLGPMNPDELAALYPSRTAVTETQLDLASSAWSTFSASDPTTLVRLLRDDTSALPHLAAALLRHIEQFPAAEDGLSRTERQILEIVSHGASRAEAIFRADQDREERIFMGDLVFYSYLEGLSGSRAPLVRIDQRGSSFSSSRFEVTPEGEAVLRGEADRVNLNGIDCWRGGVHLQGSGVWRWSRADRDFVR